jgi:hypothetical protein
VNKKILYPPFIAALAVILMLIILTLLRAAVWSFPWWYLGVPDFTAALVVALFVSMPRIRVRRRAKKS